MFLVYVIGCSRCGGDHGKLKGKVFAKPPAAYVSECKAGEEVAWATCPETGDPIIAIVGAKKKPRDAVKK